MKKSNPWDVLPREPYGDETEDALYLAVGKALTAWEELDNEQGSLFAVIVLSQDSAANAAYGSVASGPGRGSMVIAAADQIFGNFDPVLLKEITSWLTSLVGCWAAGTTLRMASCRVSHSMMADQEKVSWATTLCRLITTPESALTRRLFKSASILCPGLAASYRATS
jgi:hypothetical protein